MPRQAGIPTYRHHKQSGQAVVTLRDALGTRRDILLGKFGTPESRAEYARVIAEWEANGHRLPAPKSSPSDLTINELAVAYFRHAEAYYIKDGAPTSEVDTIRQALRFLKRLYGHALARDFSPLALKTVREEMIRHPITRTCNVKDEATAEVREVVKVLRIGLARKTINKQIDRVRRMFSWAVENELLPASVCHALREVAGLRKGRSAARETAKVKPVPEEAVEKTLPLLPPAVADMVRVQRLTGMRPQEVTALRPCDIDMSGPVWEYRPGRYKTEHHEDKERVVYIGPRAQAILRGYFSLSTTSYLFCPARSVEARNAKRRQERKTPMTPSQRARTRKAKPKRAPRGHYDVASYRRAIRRACLTAAIPVWFPNQLRHSAGTEVRKRFGLEASQAVLGHDQLGVTQVYAEADREAARRVMSEIG